MLIIFGVMLTSRITGVDLKTGVTGKTQIAFAGVGATALAITLICIFADFSEMKAAELTEDITINGIGTILLTDYVLAFEVASVLLLIAIVGAALIARRK